MISEATTARMREIVARYPLARSAMLPCLHEVQNEQGYVSEEGILAVADVLGVRPDEVESVVTFYSMYHLRPQGRYTIKVCTSIACYLRGCDALMANLSERLGVRPGETTPDGRYTLEGVECLAACGMAPVLQVNGAFVEDAGPERADALLNRIERDEPLGDLASHWQPIGNGGYTAAISAVAPLEGATRSASLPDASANGNGHQQNNQQQRSQRKAR